MLLKPGRKTDLAAKKLTFQIFLIYAFCSLTDRPTDKIIIELKIGHTKIAVLMCYASNPIPENFKLLPSEYIHHGPTAVDCGWLLTGPWLTIKIVVKAWS